MQAYQTIYQNYQELYEAPNVESYVFRVYGRILRDKLGINGSSHEKLLDFGCGNGTALQFFYSKGFDVFGVDISKIAVRACKQKMPSIRDHFSVIAQRPNKNNIFFGGKYDIIIALQSLYYLTSSDLATCITSLYDQMKPGAILFTTMIGTQCWFHKYSTKDEDGLRKVSLSTDRLHRNTFINFTGNKTELLHRFSKFKPLHIGYYDADYTEGSEFHYIFIGQKS